MKSESSLTPTEYRLAPVTRGEALQAVCDTVPMLMGIAELSEDGAEINHLYGNAAVARHFGVSLSDLENKPASELGVPPTLLSVWLAQLRDALQHGETVSFEYEHSQSASGLSDRKRYWSKATAWSLPVRGTNGEPRFVYLIEDITSYRAAESALRESRRFLEQVASTTPHIWYVYDLDKRRNVYANREIAEVLGYNADEIKDMGSDMLAMVVHPDDMPIVTQRFEKHVFREDGEVTSNEFRALRKDGSYCWLSCYEVPFERDAQTGLVRQMLGVCQDITERREVVERLAESESHLRLAIEGADIGTFIADFRTSIVEFSPHARRQLGLALAQDTLTLAEFETLFYEHDRAAFRAAIERSINWKNVLEGEYRVYQIDGSLRWKCIKAQFRFHATTGTVERMIGVCFDVHDRKRVEVENSVEAERQSRIAQALQRSILSVAPRDSMFHTSGRGGVTTLTTDDGNGGWQVAMLYEPALEEAQVGGDFYDMFAIDSKRTAFVVGDVAGKGLAAAESVAEIKFGLRSVLRGISADPAFALSFLNDRQIEAQTLDRRSRELLFAVTIVVAENETGNLRIARAGSEPPLICYSGSEGISLRPIADLADLPIGAMPETEYVVITETLAPGETFLLYTDGLTDSAGGDATNLIHRAVGSVLSKNTDMDCAALCRRLLDTLHAPTGYMARRDDTCLLAARRKT
ncbi:MAG: PAS domain S-box protein [Fibrella sp.]|nr:PAS domain S-box protein [Armatimonadota bacterium]